MLTGAKMEHQQISANSGWITSDFCGIYNLKSAVLAGGTRNNTHLDLERSLVVNAQSRLDAVPSDWVSFHEVPRARENMGTGEHESKREFLYKHG